VLRFLAAEYRADTIPENIKELELRAENAGNRILKEVLAGGYNLVRDEIKE
jgi:hypothetical protein